MATAALTLSVAGPASAAGEVSAAPDTTATFNGAVRAIAYAGPTVYLGGDFTRAYHGGRTFTRNRLAAVDARTGALLGWAPNADGPVRGIATSRSQVFAVGEFTTVNGVPRDSLARLSAGSGAVLSGFSHTITGVPYAVAAGPDLLYVTGEFTAVAGQPRSHLAAFALDSGALSGGWRPGADARVESIAVTADRVYLAGAFHKINGVSGSARLAAVHPTSGGYDSGFRPKASYVAHGISVSSSGVYAAHGGPGGRVVSYGSTGTTRWTLTTDGDVQTVAAFGDVIYLGGHFDNVCRSARTGDLGSCVDGSDRRVKMAAVSRAGNLLAWAPNANGVEGVYGLAFSAAERKVAFGGTFTTIGGVNQLRFVQFSG